MVMHGEKQPGSSNSLAVQINDVASQRCVGGHSRTAGVLGTNDRGVTAAGGSLTPLTPAPPTA